jgi:SAM-dependent methyltransferase
MHGTFDACITSHVIEHVPNPIGLFQSLDRLLTPNGVLPFAVPDKRYCFDFFRPITLAPAWIEALERKATRHSRRTLLEYWAYNSGDGDLSTWGQEPTPLQLRLHYEMGTAKANSDAAGTSDESAYVDCHTWMLTPSSYELLFLELGALGLLDFRIERIFPTAGHEFFVTMRKGKLNLSAQEVQSRRLELMRAIVDEQAEQANRMNGVDQFVNEVTTLRHELVELASQRDELTHQVARLTEERDGLLNSTSWRVTSPLRSLKTRIASG